MTNMIRVAAMAAVAMSLTAFAAGAQGLGGDDGRLVFGYRADAPPFSYDAGGDVAAFSGFTAELCNRLSREIAVSEAGAGIERGAVRVDAENRFEKIETGEIDVLCGAASVTEERQKRVGFSIPVLKTGIAVAVPAEAPRRFAALAEAPDPGPALAEALSEGGRVGFRSGTTTEDWLSGSALASAEGVTLEGFSDHRAGIFALTAGKIDVYMGDLAILRGLEQSLGVGLAISDHVLQDEVIALATAREADELRGMIDDVLVSLYRTGEIVPIFERHFGPMTEADRAFYRETAAANP